MSEAQRYIEQQLREHPEAAVVFSTDPNVPVSGAPNADTCIEALAAALMRFASYPKDRAREVATKLFWERV